MSKNKLIKGIEICIVLIIILMVCIKIKEKQNNELISTVSEGTLLLGGMSIFSEEYKGELESSEIRQKIQELIKEDIPELYKETKKYDDEKIKEYYSEHTSEIKKKFGIKNETEFVDFANIIKKAKIDFNKWDKVEAKPETFVSKLENENYAYIEFDTIYKDGNKMSFALKIANTTINSLRYILIAK